MTTNTDPNQTAAYRTARPFLAANHRSPTAKRDGIAAWLRDEIAYLESVKRTAHGDGALAAYRETLKEMLR